MSNWPRSILKWSNTTPAAMTSCGVSTDGLSLDRTAKRQSYATLRQSARDGPWGSFGRSQQDRDHWRSGEGKRTAAARATVNFLHVHLGDRFAEFEALLNKIYS